MAEHREQTCFTCWFKLLPLSIVSFLESIYRWQQSLSIVISISFYFRWSDYEELRINAKDTLSEGIFWNNRSRTWGLSSTVVGFIEKQVSTQHVILYNS